MIFSILSLFTFISLVHGQNILGCMDSYAENYNIDATTDDGSCAGYPDNGDHSLSFDGIDDYGYLSWNNQLSTYTVSMWVRAHDLNQISYQAFFNNSSTSNQGFQLDCNNNEQYRFLSSNGSILLAPLDLEWAHVSITSDGTTTAAYFNGELIETVNWVVTGWDQIVLGRNRSTNERGNYNLDEISIWNTSKSITEIQELMNNDFDVNEEGLLIYWKANAGESNILFDHTGNTNHMTLYGATWIDGNPGYPQIEVLPDAISHLAYTGESSNQSFTIYNNGNDDLEWVLSFNNQERINVPFALPEGFTTQNNVSGNISTGPVLVGQSNINNNSINRDQYDIWIYNNSGVASTINGHESLNAVTGSVLDINNFDVFFNIRSSNYNPEETLEWIYNGGTWVGEWTSNDYPINNWNVIEGSVYTGTVGAYGTPIIQDPNHWLAQNIDWGSVPVGTQAVEFMRNIIIDDPDATVIVSLNHASYGEVPLLVEKNYGEGTIILFNCDYQDAPHTISDLIQKVAYYAAAIAGKVEWLSVSDTLGTVLPGNSTEIELTFDATSLATGDYESEFYIISNDPNQPAVNIPVNLEVDMYYPNIILSLDSVYIDLFLGGATTRYLTIQNDGDAELNWFGNISYSWMSISPEFGVVTTGGEQIVELSFNTNQWTTGTYLSSLHIMSNDENEPDLYIPLSLNIFENIEAPEFEDSFIYEDSTLTLLLPDLYSEYSTEYVISSDTSDVNINIISDSLILSPIENWAGSALIEVVLIAEDTLTDTTFFILNVMPVNDNPRLSTIEDTTMIEDSSLSIPLIFSDVDNEELSLSVTSSHVDYLDMEIIDTTLYIVPNPDWNCDSILVYVSVNDNMDRSIAEEQFFLTIYPVNDAPIALDEEFFVEEDSDTLFVLLLASDGDSTESLADDQLLNFSIISGFNHGHFDFVETEGHLIYIPNENYFGVDSLRYIVTDNGLTGNQSEPLSDTALVIINVLPVNDSPIIGSISDTVMNEDSFIQIPIDVTDVDDDSLSLISFSNDSSYISVINEDGYLNIMSNLNWNGSTIVTVIVNDNIGRAIDIEEFQLTVEPVNDLPEFENNLNVTVGVGIHFEFNLYANDVDMDSTFFMFDNTFDYPDWFTIESNPDRLLGSVPVGGTFDFPIILSDGDSSITDTFNITAHYFEPRINFVTDVPEDQGEKVYLNFQKSYLDILDTPNQFYTIFRNDTVGDTTSWIGIGSLTASGSEVYTTEVPTLRDSSSINNGLTEFKVISFMNIGTFESEIMIGYSLDNIAPEVPQDLSVTIVEDGIEIFWSTSTDDNFNFFNLDKSNEESFLNYQTFIINDTFYIDVECEHSQEYFYRLSAVDLSGNVSDYSAIMGVTTLKLEDDLIPREFALYQNYPNPFNPVTTIRYDLPVSSDILIRIFDINGRIVKTIFSGYKKAGHNSAVWDAKNDIGEPVSAGMYLYFIQSNEYQQTRKMLLLK